MQEPPAQGPLVRVAARTGTTTMAISAAAVTTYGEAADARHRVDPTAAPAEPSTGRSSRSRGGRCARRCTGTMRRLIAMTAPSLEPVTTEAARSRFLDAVRATLPDAAAPRRASRSARATGTTRPPTSRPGCRSPSPCRRRPPRSPTLVRLAAEHRIPIVPRGAGSGLSGGAAGIEGGLTIALTKMDAVLEIDRENLVVVTQPGILNAELKKRVAAEGLFYAPDPGELRDLLDRREPRDERRRPVLREVRPDARLRARAGGRPRRRPRDPDRRQVHQEHRRLRADPPVRRVAGDARDHHRGDASAAGRAAAADDDARVLPDPRRRRRCGRPDRRRRDRHGDARAARPAVDRRGRRRVQPRARPRGGGDAARRVGSARAGCARRARRRGRRLRGRRVRRRRCGPPMRPRPTGCARPGASPFARSSGRGSSGWRTSASRAAACRTCSGRSTRSGSGTASRSRRSATPATATSTRTSSSTTAIHGPRS